MSEKSRTRRGETAGSTSNTHMISRIDNEHSRTTEKTRTPPPPRYWACSFQRAVTDS